MGFFNPGLLWFALGGAVPVIIHLLHRQKYRRIQWAAMEFLLAAIKKTQRRLRIENLILLLLRILIMILLALAITRPFLRASPLDLMASTDTHHILVIDNSYSMGYKKGPKSLLDYARESADTLLKGFANRLSESDKITVILGSAYPETHLAYASNLKNIQESVNAIKVSHYGSSMYQTFQLVKETIEKSRNQEKRVYTFTDMQRCGWQGGDEVEIRRFKDLLKSISNASTTKVSLIDVSRRDSREGKEPSDNRALVGLRVSENVISVKRTTIMHADLYNWSAVSYPNVDVKFMIDGSHIGTVSTPLPPNSPMTVTFRHEFNEPGPHFVEAVIDSDQLDLDDRRYLALDVKQGIQVLLVDGEPESPPDYSDADYLKFNLLESRYNVTGPVTNEMFTGEGLEKVDVVALCNVQSLTQDKVEKLEDFVKRGGGLFINLGDKVDRGSYNDLLFREGKGLLPGLLGDVGGSSAEIQPRVPLHIFRYDNRHPMFSAFTGGFKRGPFNLVFYQHYRLEKFDPDWVLADLDDPVNSPLFVEKRFGDGKVVLYTSTIDEEWSDRLPGNSPFPITLWQLFPYLASRPMNAKNLAVGEPIQLALTSDQYAREFSVETPHEGLSTTSPEAPRPDSKWFHVFYPSKPTRSKPEEGKPQVNEGVKFAGKYSLIRPRVKSDEEEKLISYFAVNLPPRSSAAEEIARCEGNLEKIDVNELRSLYSDFKFELVGDKGAQDLATDKPTSMLWKYVLYLLLIFMGLETFLAWFFGRAKQ